MTMKVRLLTVLIFATVLTAGAEPARQTNVSSKYPYKVVRLWSSTELTIPYSSFFVTPSLNDLGEVSGVVMDNHAYHAVVYNAQGQRTTLGAGLVGPINSYGTMVGSTYTTPVAHTTPLIFNGRTIINLGSITPSYSGEATAINTLGQVVGGYAIYDANGTNTGFRAFLYQNGKLTLLGDAKQRAYAYGINNSGMIIGSALFSDGYQPAIYTGGAWKQLGILPNGNGVSGNAIAVNNLGWVVCYFATQYNNLNGCALYKDGKMTDLHLPNSTPITPFIGNINDRGQIVAAAGPNTDGYLYDHGKWTKLAQLIDPNYGLSFGYVYWINNSGLILAEAIRSTKTGGLAFGGAALLAPQ